MVELQLLLEYFKKYGDKGQIITVQDLEMAIESVIEELNELKEKREQEYIDNINSLDNH